MERKGKKIRNENVASQFNTLRAMQIEFFLPPPNGTHFILFFSVLVLLFFEETVYISAQIGGEEAKL